MIAQLPVKKLPPARVLVLAPRFPSINQPWIDTYLEQFLRRGVAFRVARLTGKTEPYQDKVDRLGLRSFAVNLPGVPIHVALVALVVGVRWPAIAFRIAIDAWKLHSGAQHLRGRLSAVAHAVSVLPVLAHHPRLSVVHSHNDFLGVRLLPATRTLGLPLVVTFHGLEPHGLSQLEPELRRALGEYASTVLVNTSYARQQAIAVGFPPARLRILPQGLPLEDFPFNPSPPIAEGETLNILSVGRFHRDKGQEYSLIALARLKRSGIDAHWNFVGVGPNLARLHALAKRLGVQEQVSFLQGLSAEELRLLYAKCHLFVLASVGNGANSEHTETQGVVLQEAQASGCIPIATAVGGIPECINDGEDGVLVADRSHRSIANGILELLQRRSDWPQIQRRGRENVEVRFSADKIGEAMLKELEQAAMVNSLNA